jgi:hypothetical protein
MVLLILAASPFVVTLGINEFRLNRFKSQIWDIELPEPSRVLASGSDIRPGAGSADDCLFQVTLVVEVSARSEAISVFVERVKSMQFRPVREHEDGGGPEVFVSRDRLIVTIVVSDGPWKSTFDLRCL